ncbi:MAG: DUF3048 C-terminal domain-containing protein [Anaerolineaceae bacterium]|nr:DUF3048 C-terminal domain-containing protein [Anaerolineaceae bacterium]
MDLPLKSHDRQAAADLFVFYYERKRNIEGMMKCRKYLLTSLTVLIMAGCTLQGYLPNEKVNLLKENGSEEPTPTISPILNIMYKENLRSAGDETRESEGGQDSDEPEGEDEHVSNSSINPLTGLPVSNPENLRLPPALVSVTNFPPSARPQAGLSTSSIVFELYIGEGMTRYLAIFYGDYPKSSIQENSGNLQEGLSEGMPEPVIGPIRSGRLPYEYVRKLFNGFIVMASAYSKVADHLGNYVNIYGNDDSDGNSALITVDQVEKIAKESGEELGDTALSGMQFDENVPEGGKDAHSLWIFYAYLNQVFWRFNEEDGSYHRWQDNADGTTFIEQTDRLNGDPLTYENVIVLFADHKVEKTFLIDIDLLYVKKEKAILFRDGKMYKIYWTTKSGEYERATGKLRPIRFIDADGNPFPLKPGQTWIELMPNYYTPFWETVDSEDYSTLAKGRSEGSGYWGLYFKLGK